MSFRTQGVAALATVLNNKKNIEILERALYDEVAVGRDTEDDYKCAIYQILSDVQAGNPIKVIYRNIKNGKIGWKHHSFDAMARRIAEQNEFIENPFEVEEGVHTCQKCGSKRVFSYNRQVRGGDEGTGVFCAVSYTHLTLPTIYSV